MAGNARPMIESRFFQSSIALGESVASAEREQGL